ncbi:MAG: hypothetical protein FWD26_06220 [Treponema sp.]|nr:hypothetical protein [Treponema sp.]
MKKAGLIFIFSLLFLITTELYGGHKGNVTAVIHNGNTVLTCGEDGFLVTWNINQRTSIDRFQLTSYRIQSVVKHPAKNEICIIEEASFDSYRISAWNFALKEKLFTVHSNKPVTFINYSATGNFLIAAGIDGYPLTILNPSTGEVIKDLVIPSGKTSYAVTGRAERNMLVYQSEHGESSYYSGSLFYFDIETQTVTGSFQAPPSLLRPVVFGNNRFLAGVNHDGLQIVDTTTGLLLDSMENIGRNAVLCLSSDGFYCLDQRNNNSILYHFSIDRNGRLVTRQRLPLSLENTINSIAFNTSLILATSKDNILMLSRQNTIVPFTYHFNSQITEIASSQNTIAFFTEDGYFSVIPLDYSNIQNSGVTFAKSENYNKITSFTFSNEDYYILWQTENTRLHPILIKANNENPQSEGQSLEFLSGRFPLRAISVLNSRIIVLDSGGNITGYNLGAALDANAVSDSRRPFFTFSSVGAIDIAFLNENYIIVSRSVINNNSPFLSVSIRTGETVPFSHGNLTGIMAGLAIYIGKSGAYGAAIQRHEESLNTVFLKLSDPSFQNSLYSYGGEAHNLSITETQGAPAILCDSDGAKILTPDIKSFERTRGLPVKLLGGTNTFLCLDSEGNIAWHDSGGKIQAVFSIQKDSWTLVSGREITGKIIY